MKIYPVEDDLYADRRTDGQPGRTKQDETNIRYLKRQTQFKGLFLFSKISSHEVTTRSNHGVLIDATD